MCSQSISGSSLLSAYDDDDLRETSGRTRRDFEQIDAVLYDEEIAKRSSINKICEEWSSKPHFRIRGRQCPMDRQWDQRSNRSHSLKISSLSMDTVLLDQPTSGRSSIDSTEGSELTNNSDLDHYDDDDHQISDRDNQTPNGRFHQRFSADAADSFDTDDDDDDDEDNDNSGQLSDMSRRTRIKYPRFLTKCLKNTILTNLFSSIVKQFLHDQQELIQRYGKYLYSRHSIRIRSKPRPSSLPPRPRSRNRLSLPTTSLITSNNLLFQQQQQQQQAQTMISASMPFRPPSEPNNELDGILMITGLKNTQSILANSPRKSQINVPIEKPQSMDRRTPNQSSMSLIGTAMGSGSVQSAPLQPRTTPLNPRFRSATTIISNLTNHNESIPRLPPITNEQLMISRSNTISSTIIESVGTPIRTISSTSTTPNLASTTKARRITRTSRSVITKDNHSSSTSPTRSLTGTAISTTTLRPTAAPRIHQLAPKRPLITTRTPAASSTSNPIKISPTHIYQMTN